MGPTLEAVRPWAYSLAFVCTLVVGGKVTFGHQGSPPEVLGVRLGASPTRVVALLGRPDSTRRSIGLRFWTYEPLGITLIWREGVAGVSGIVVRKPAGGPVRGVSVGASVETLTRQWGTPARIRQDGRFSDFAGDGWSLSVEVRDGTVIEMTLLAAVPES